jgi:hypothetical protein
MRRKRYMKGSVRPRKHGKLKVWVAQWWEDGHRRSKVFGRCSEMTRGQAEVALNEIIAPLNRKAGQLRRCLHVRDISRERVSSSTPGKVEAIYENDNGGTNAVPPQAGIR